jgi:hypothetical protein
MKPTPVIIVFSVFVVIVGASPFCRLVAMLMGRIHTRDDDEWPAVESSPE